MSRIPTFYSLWLLDTLGIAFRIDIRSLRPSLIATILSVNVSWVMELLTGVFKISKIFVLTSGMIKGNFVIL